MYKQVSTSQKNTINSRGNLGSRVN
jgi:hypothetical protein